MSAPQPNAPHPAFALQRAVQATVASDTELTALIGARLFDRVPDRARYPYVTHGAVETLPLEGEGEAADDPGGAAVQHLMTLDVWSRARGRREVLAVLAGLRRALHRAAPSLDGHRLVSLREVSASALPDEDGVQRGSATYRAVTEPRS